MFTFEYLPGIRNVIADKESRVMKDFSEWKLNRKFFFKITSCFGSPEIDLFASRVLYQLPVYISWKQDPYSNSQDAFQSKWKYRLSYASPSFCMIGLREGLERSKLFNTNHPRLASATLVSQTTTDECGVSNVTLKVLKTPYKPFREPSSPDRKQYLDISGLVSFSENLETKGISKKASDLISSSRRPGTISHYESSLRKWVCWCNRKKVSPNKCEIKFIFDFLASLFDEGFQ